MVPKGWNVSYPRLVAERRLGVEPDHLTLEELAYGISLQNTEEKVVVRDHRTVPAVYSSVYFQGRTQE